jgi:2,5-furandicarboxylate decarboxylase 1
LANLRQFLSELKKINDLICIQDEVSVQYEIAAILKLNDGGPALLFERVKNYQNPVVAGICGTRERVYLGLTTKRENFYERLYRAIKAPISPKIVDDCSVKEVVEKPNLRRIPILTHYEMDPGPYLTSAIVTATSPDGSIENVSFHRMLVVDERHLAIRVVGGRHLQRLYRMADAQGKPLDVAITIGLHPAIMLAAATPAPFGVSEYGIANALLDGKLKLTKCEHVEAHVPADAELVLEGKLYPKKEVPEGPFVDITQTYDVVRNQPIIEITGVMRRRDFYYQALLPGGLEHRLLMGLPIEAKILEAVQGVVPVKAVNLTPGGCNWFHAVISIDKQYEGDGKNALLAAFAAHKSLKHAIVVDLDIDVFDMEQVEWAIATRFRGEEDLLVIDHVRGSSLDPASDQELELTTKIGIDATRPLSKPSTKFEKAKHICGENVTNILRKIQARREA